MTEAASSASPTPTEAVDVGSRPARGHESADISIGGIWKTGVVLAVVVGLCLFLLYRLVIGLERSAARIDPAVSPMTGSQTPPPPHLQPRPREALAEMRAEEEAKLGEYRWIDRERKVVQLPIERAMQLLAERGFPEVKPATSGTASPPPTAKERPR